MNCTACGNGLNFGSRFCSNCGHAVAEPATTPPAQPYAPFQNQQRIVRPRYGRMLGGVCAGFAQHFGWDVAFVRLSLCAIVIFGCGLPLLAYLIAWIVIPNEPYFYTTAAFTQAPPQPAAPTNSPAA
jgi:phage shock protein C